MHFVGMSVVSFDNRRVSYRVDLTITSLVVVIVMCYGGIYICAQDRAFTIEKVDTIDAFIRGASEMSIEEMKKMRSSKYILIMALFYKAERLIIGGMFTGCGVCVMHYLGMMAMIVEGVDMPAFNPGIVAASALIAMVSKI
jgi:NO-binding membrane sensor protein with MHYT domain